MPFALIPSGVWPHAASDRRVHRVKPTMCNQVTRWHCFVALPALHIAYRGISASIRIQVSAGSMLKK